MTADTHSFYLAPLRGVTDYIFRNAFEQYFGKFDFLVAPFTPTVKGTTVNPSVVRDITPEHNDITRVIPQIIGNVASEILVMSKKMVDLGYTSVNFNLGCPFTPVARKKRGSGMLPYPEMVQSILEELIPQMPCTLSIKLRLGFHDEHEIDRVMPVLNAFPLKEITIHPRTGAQLYSGTVNLDGFQRALLLCKHTVIYNGDIFTVDDFKRISARFPTINKWMIGRGLIQNPFLLQSLRTDRSHFKKEDLQNFHNDIYEQNNTTLSGPSHLLGKMKGLWSYMAEPFEDGKKILKKLQKTSSIAAYKDLADQFFEKLQ